METIAEAGGPNSGGPNSGVPNSGVPNSVRVKQLPSKPAAWAVRALRGLRAANLCKDSTMQQAEDEAVREAREMCVIANCGDAQPLLPGVPVWEAEPLEDAPVHPDGFFALRSHDGRLLLAGVRVAAEPKAARPRSTGAGAWVAASASAVRASP